MPLTRENVTVASRIMLPTYIGHAAFFGLLYILNPQGRLDRAPGLALARDLLPMQVWGSAFLLIAAVMLSAIVRCGRRRFTFGLYLYATTLLIWTGVYAGAVFIDPAASPGGFAWPLVVAIACLASARSLEQQEV